MQLPEEVADSDKLYRRIAPGHATAEGDVLSQAFKYRGKPADRVSINLARLSNTDATAMRDEKPGSGVGELTAGAVRAIGLDVRHEPLPENYAHALILGAKTNSHCKQLARATKIVIQPDQNPPR